MTFLELIKTLHRSFALARIAADEFAAGQLKPAKQSLAQAEAQYIYALRALLTSSDLTHVQTEEFQRELADLTDTLAAMNRQLKQLVVLVVHDDDSIRRSAVEAVEMEGHIALAAESVEQGLEISRAYIPAIHLALTPFRSRKGLAGLEFCRLIALERPGILAAAISGERDRHRIPGHIHVIPEPFSELQFRRRICGLLWLCVRRESASDGAETRVGRNSLPRDCAADAASILSDHEMVRRDMMAAGRRLIDELRLEENATLQFSKDPGDEGLQHEWQEAGRAVELAQLDYDDSIEHYRRVIREGPAEPDTSGPAKTILLLEDDHTISTLVTRMLERRGCAVLQARAGEDAAAISERYQGRIDLMIADVILRDGEHGLEVAQRLAELRPEVPVLFISGFPEDQLANRGLLDPGMFPFRKAAFLQKPFSRQALEARIRELIGVY